MRKELVEQILIIVKSGDQEALNMKVYKNGTLCRRGCGGLPETGISAMSITESPVLFDSLMNQVPQQVLDQSVNHVDEQIDTPLEYILAFYGVSRNGDTGEHAEWTESTGIRFLLDTNTAFRHPLLGFVDGFSIEAAEQTNSWYFDVIINAVYHLKSTALPEQTMIAVPSTPEEIQTALELYVNQIGQSPRRWDLLSFAQDKLYTAADETRYYPAITRNGNAYNFNFIPLDEKQPGSKTMPGEKEEKKKRWKWW